MEQNGEYTQEERKKYQELEDSRTSYGWIMAVGLIPFYSIYSAIHGITLQNELLELEQKRIKEKQNKGIKLSLRDENKLKEEKIGFGWKILAFFFPPYTYYRAISRFRIENELINQKQQEIIDKHNQNKNNENINNKNNKQENEKENIEKNKSEKLTDNNENIKNNNNPEFSIDNNNAKNEIDKN